MRAEIARGHTARLAYRTATRYYRSIDTEIRSTDTFVKVAMRADARKNRSQLLEAARAVVAEHGTDASLREIARRADVGLPTLYRHFPTRDALLEALLHDALDRLTRRAGELEALARPDDALVSWLREGVAFVKSYHGVVDIMATAIGDETSALHASCTAVRSAGASLLRRAQAEGSARDDIDGVDLFALMGALGWLGEQSSFASRADHLFDVVSRALTGTSMTSKPSLKGLG